MMLGLPAFDRSPSTLVSPEALEQVVRMAMTLRARARARVKVAKVKGKEREARLLQLARHGTL